MTANKCVSGQLLHASYGIMRHQSQKLRVH